MTFSGGRSRTVGARLRLDPEAYLTAIGEPCEPVPPRIGDGE